MSTPWVFNSNTIHRYNNNCNSSERMYTWKQFGLSSFYTFCLVVYYSTWKFHLFEVRSSLLGSVQENTQCEQLLILWWTKNLIDPPQKVTREPFSVLYTNFPTFMTVYYLYTPFNCLFVFDSVFHCPPFSSCRGLTFRASSLHCVSVDIVFQFLRVLLFAFYCVQLSLGKLNLYVTFPVEKKT